VPRFIGLSGWGVDLARKLKRGNKTKDRLIGPRGNSGRQHVVNPFPAGVCLPRRRRADGEIC
jgi:hypothetical protein